MKYLVWICELNDSGGLGDRIRGLISTYCLSKYLDRRFLIMWNGPDISDIIKIGDEYNFYGKNGPPPNLRTMFFNFINNNALKFPEDFKQVIGDTDIVFIKTNQNVNRKYYKKFINGSEEEYKTTMLNAYRSVFTDFLIPTKVLLDYMNQIIPTKPVIGIHFRIGNEHLFYENENFGVKAKPIIEKVLARVEKYIKDNELMVDNDYSYFVTSDCSTIDEITKNFFSNSREILSYKGGTMDMGFCRDCDKGVYFKIFADIIMLSRCDMLFGTGNSGFSKIPVMISNNKSFICYMYQFYTMGYIDAYGNFIKKYDEYTKNENPPSGQYDEEIVPFVIDDINTSYIY